VKAAVELEAAANVEAAVEAAVKLALYFAVEEIP
jgi:hypothetical protein